MEIVDTRNTVCLNHIKRGDLFEYLGLIYMKVGPVSDLGGANCVQMSSGEVVLFPCDTQVKCQAGKLVLE
jgi:hypothetical protein